MYIELELTIFRNEEMDGVYRVFWDKIVAKQEHVEAKINDLMIRSPTDKFFVSAIMIVSGGVVYRRAIAQSEWLPLIDR